MNATAPRLKLTILTALTAPIAAQATISVPLNYNFNGIVHAGEMGLPDDPNGFRSISDRALDFLSGVPADPLLAPYQFVTTPAMLDIVHLGNRNTVDNGNWAFEPLPNANDIGIQPLWLLNVDQSTPQTTVLTTPLPIGATTEVAFLYQISNGGGAFDVTFMFASSGSYTASLSASDWFGGTFLGTDSVDTANFGANLSITESRVDMSAHAGQLVTQISFSNRSNLIAGYAILACNFEYPIAPRRVNRIGLNYNFNGIVHAGEAGLPDDPIGYRSISDRGLDFMAGVPTNAVLLLYALVDVPGALDIVHLGNRNTVAGGTWAFDALPDGDDIGIQPLWLPNADQTGPQATVLAEPILMDVASQASLLFQISNGGGSFDVEFGFQTGSPVIASVTGGDWFGGGFLGIASTDSATAGANLSLSERTIDLSAEAGRTLTSIAFQNASNANAGYAVVAMNVSGCLSCLNGTAGSVQDLGGGNGPALSSLSNGNLGCDLDWTVVGATPSAPFAIMALGLGSLPVPLGALLPNCTGTVHVVNPAVVPVIIDASGQGRAVIAAPSGQFLCGVQITGQYAELVAAPCLALMSNAVMITIGN